MTDVDPMKVAAVAAVDQNRAHLNHLVAVVREHLPTCDVSQYGGCVGSDAYRSLLHHPDMIFSLLCIALVELARVGEPVVEP